MYPSVFVVRILPRMKILRPKRSNFRLTLQLALSYRIEVVILKWTPISGSVITPTSSGGGGGEGAKSDESGGCFREQGEVYVAVPP